MTSSPKETKAVREWWIRPQRNYSEPVVLNFDPGILLPDMIHVLAADDVKELVGKLEYALRYWVDFEEACITKDGPYCSPEIPKRISKAKEALQLIEESGVLK